MDVVNRAMDSGVLPHRDPVLTTRLLLGMVIERATGQGLGEVLRERFFDPLELDDTYSQAEGEPPVAGAPALYVALRIAEKEEDRKVSLREFLSWSLVFCLISSFFCYIFAMLIWVLPYAN